MQSIYRLKADELNADFVEGLKLIFKDKEIEIIVSVVKEDIVKNTSETVSVECVSEA